MMYARCTRVVPCMGREMRGAGDAFRASHPAAAMAMIPRNRVLPMCACAERRVAIVEGVAALAMGDARKALARAAFVAMSAQADAGVLIAAARARLGARLAR